MRASVSSAFSRVSLAGFLQLQQPHTDLLRNGLAKGILSKCARGHRENDFSSRFSYESREYLKFDYDLHNVGYVIVPGERVSRGSRGFIYCSSELRTYCSFVTRTAEIDFRFALDFLPACKIREKKISRRMMIPVTCRTR